METIKLHSIKTHLGEYWFCPRNNPTQNTFLYTPKHQIYHLDMDFELRQCGFFSKEAKSGFGSKISFHPFLHEVAFVMNDVAYVPYTPKGCGSLAKGDFAGNILWKREGKFSTVLFSRDGAKIWAAENLDNEYLKLSVFDSQSGDILASKAFDDEMFQSDLRLSDIPWSDDVTLKLGAGQDGIMVYALGNEAATITMCEMFPSTSCITPAWHPEGKKLLTLENDEHRYYQYSWPEPAVLARQEDVDFEDDDDNIRPGYGLVFLRDGLAVTQSATYRLFLFDPDKMERIAEIVIPGFEPMPTNVVFPRLKDDTAPYSLITYFSRVGNIFIARTGKETKTQAVFLFDISRFTDNQE
ncbi:MAG: hypothetical protein LBQ91_01555 [Oscillospiraceae bacterium]|jgi:hypothetical protein|nr:hypothetical protein [Oscillospiraceae bacterium]